MDFEPVPEEERRRSDEVLQFIKKINDIFELKEVKGARDYSEITGQFKSVALCGPREFIMRLGIEFTQGGAEGDKPEFSLAPEDFSYPRYVVEIWDYKTDSEELVMTPYGPQRSLIVDRNGHLWALEDFYLFDKDTHSKRFLRVYKFYSEDDVVEQETTSELAEKIRVDFVPKEEDSGLVDLTPGDFEKLGYFFDLVKKGEMKPLK